MPSASVPCSLIVLAMFVATRSSASSQVVSTHSASPALEPTPDTFFMGTRSRSGSAWMSASATPLGQMWPRDRGSASLPRMAVTRSPCGPGSMVSSSPQIASHRLHTPSVVVMRPIVPCCSDTPVCRAQYCAFRSTVHRMDTTQLLKGVLDLAVLAVVDGEDGYGYDIVRRLRDGGLSEVGDASVYGTLRRLYAAGALTSYVVPSESGPHRKYYGITPI